MRHHSPTHAVFRAEPDERLQIDADPAQNHTHMPAPEAHLLRLIEQTLERQRRQEAAANDAQPLVDRVETILGKKAVATSESSTLDTSEAEPVVVIVDADHNAVPVFNSKTQKRSFSRSLPLASALLGGLLMALLPAGPTVYRADSALKFPASARSATTSPSEMANQVVSPRIISGVVSALRLDRDAEFAATGWLDVAFDLLSPSGKAADAVSRAEAKLAASLTASAKDSIVTYSVATHDQVKSAKIASEVAAQISPSSGIVVPNAARAEKEAADAEFSAFVKKSGEGNVKAATVLQQRIDAADENLKQVEQRLADANNAAARLKTATPDEIVAAAFPPSLMSPALRDMRERYTIAKAALARLSVDLGPRHPKLIASHAQAEDLKTGISKELARLQRQADQDSRTAANSRKQWIGTREALLAQSRDTGVDLVRLASLRDRAKKAQMQMDDAITTAGIPYVEGVHLVASPKITTVSSSSMTMTRLFLGMAGGLVLGFVLMAIPMVTGSRKQDFTSC